MIFNTQTKLFDLDTLEVFGNNPSTILKFNKKPATLMVAKRKLKTTYDTGEGETYEISFEKGDVIYIKSSIGYNLNYYLNIDGINGFPHTYKIMYVTVQRRGKSLRIAPAVQDDEYLGDILSLIFNDENFEILDIPEKVHSTLDTVINNIHDDYDNTTVSIYIKYIENGNLYRLQIYTDDDIEHEYDCPMSRMMRSTFIEWELKQN